MSGMTEFAGGHLGFCLAEMMAEIDEQLAAAEAVRALEQLDAREAAGEPLQVVNSETLRARLVRQIAENPLTLARRKLVELQNILDPSMVRAVAGVTAVAKPDVTDLAAYREAKSLVPSRPRAPRRVANSVVAVAMLMLSGLASLSYTAWIGRMPGLDVSSPVTTMPTLDGRIGMADTF